MCTVKWIAIALLLNGNLHEENLTKIAKEFNATVANLAKDNNIENKDLMLKDANLVVGEQIIESVLKP